LANSYFQFKSFTVQQEFCSMKVCTEACLFGAWLADYFKGQELTAALDIGTGTGLLSLQLSQQVSIHELHAIELDPSASQQASENFMQSPWAASMQVIQGDVLSYAPAITYDLIFSNPPFFEQSLRSPDKGKNLAKHESGLELPSFFSIADRLLNANGWLALLLPFQRADTMVKLAAESGLLLRKRTNVCQTEKHTPFRSMLLYKKGLADTVFTDQLIIRQDGEYSQEFIRLLQPYYLYL